MNFSVDPMVLLVFCLLESVSSEPKVLQPLFYVSDALRYKYLSI